MDSEGSCTSRTLLLPNESLAFLVKARNERESRYLVIDALLQVPFAIPRDLKYSHAMIDALQSLLSSRPGEVFHADNCAFPTSRPGICSLLRQN
jgi:hypothetical protein